VSDPVPDQGARMRRLGASTLIVGALLLAGCGGSHPTSTRTSVADYVMQINGVERSLGVPLLSVTRVAAQFSRSKTSNGTKVVNQTPAEQHAALQVAVAQMVPLRNRLATLTTPAQAQRLRTVLLELTDRQISLARELSKLVVFLPGFTSAMGPLTPAVTDLERTLGVNQAHGPAAVAQVYTQKATALRHFRSIVLGILARVQQLKPPAASTPTYRTQIRALQGMARAAGGLAAALPNGNSTSVSGLLARFDRAATEPVSLAAQRAQASAIRAYDAELSSLNGLAEQASRERLRLNKSLH
jgi:hypothetical protein